MNLSLTSSLGTDQKPKFRVIALMLAVLSFGIYAGTIGHGYNMDDELVTQGHRLTSKGFSAIGQIFTSPYYEDEMGYSYEYRPITHVSFAIEQGLFGERAVVSHLINVLLHSVTVLLVFLVSRMMFPLGSQLFPLLAALLFAVHPMHTEAVASIKNRDELLALLFGMGALFHVFRTIERSSVLHWLLISLFLLLSLLSKTSGAAFLFLVPACVFLRKDVSSLKVVLLLILTLLPLCAFSALAVIPVQFLTVGAFLLVTSFTVVLLWKVDYGRIWKALRTRKHMLRPKGWPEAQRVTIVPVMQGLDASDLRTGLLALAVFVVGHLANLPVLYAPVLGALLFAPYWTGTYRTGHFLLLFTLLAAHYQFQDYASGLTLPSLVLLLVPLIYLSNDSRPDRRFLLLAGAGVLPLAVVEHNLSFPESSDQWLRYALSVIGPVAIIGVTVAFRNRGSILLKLLWTVTCTALLIDFISTPSDLAFLLFVGNLVCFVLVVFRWPQRWPRPQHFMVALIAVTAFSNAGKSLFIAMNQHLSESAAIDPVILSASTASASDTLAQDRPLSYVEFPLGLEASVSKKLGTSSVILGHYLKMMFIPWPQAFYYGYDEVPMTDMRDLWALASAAVHLLLVILALYFARSHPLLSFGMVAYLASIFLYSNLISPVAGMMGDRLTYVASFGFCIALAYVLTMLHGRFDTPTARKVFAVALGALLVTWSGMTVARSVQWNDALTLMRHDIKHVPNSAQAHNLLASHLMMNSFEPEYAREAMDMRMEAIGHFKQAVRIWPEFFNVWYDLGRSYMTINQPDNALPAYKETHRLDSTFYDAAINVAVISEQLGNLAQAVEYYERCIRLNPEMLEPYGNLSYLHYKEGHYEESIEVNERAIGQNPNWADPYLNIARTYETMGRPDKAAEFRAKAPKQ